jgi:hypothetical protein
MAEHETARRARAERLVERYISKSGVEREISASG